jgi:hypothetical protein
LTTHTSPLTALGPPLPGTRAIASAGDVRGRVFEVQPDLRLTPLATAGQNPVLRLLLCGDLLIAVDAAGRLSRIDAAGIAPIPCEPVIPDAVDVMRDGRLVAGVRAGLSAVDPRLGTRVIVECSVVGPVVCAREDAQGRYRAAAGETSVGVQALDPNLRGVTIARPGVRAISVDFDARILASADNEHRLALSAWGN